MEVNQVTDHVTHAVIGTNKVREMEISGDASMFNILSSNLYSNKLLAAAREVLCNAWDIHKVTGRTDTPVEIILSSEGMSIRDHGTGLPDDQMVPLYGRFGASTKIHDGLQTGGFGLGSKAPFAIADHFQVTSWHAGMKTIYVVSKSSAEVGGKPGINPIISVPTKETGLEVSVNLKPGESIKLGIIIKTLVLFGDMNVVMNGSVLKRLPFNKATDGYMMLPFRHLDATVNIRYGDVIYPVPETTAFDKPMREAKELLRSCLSDDLIHGSPRLILQAQPHTISVTPSRESLSMTDNTISTIKGLLEKFIENHKRLPALVEEMIPMKVNDIWNSFDQMSSLAVDQLTNFDRFKSDKVRPVYSIDGMATSYAAKAYPNFPKFGDKDIRAQLNALIESNLPNKGKIQSFAAAYFGDKSEKRSPWLHKTVIAPLIHDLDAADNLSSDRLFIYGTPTYGDGRSRNYGAEYLPAAKFPSRRVIDYIPFLRNFVILTYKRGDVDQRVPMFPCMAHFYGNTKESFYYVVPRAPAKIEAAKAFFEAQGMFVIDLTIAHPWEDEEINTVIRKPKKKPEDIVKRQLGIPLLGNALTKDKELEIFNLRGPDSKYTETPEVVISVGAHWATGSVKEFPLKHLTTVAQVFGDRIAVAGTTNQREKYSLGLPEWNSWLIDQLIDKVTNNPDVRAAFAIQNAKPSNIRYDYEQFFDMIVTDDVCRKQLKLGKLTDEAIRLAKLIEYVNDTYYRWDRKKIQELRAIYIKIPPTPETKAFGERFEKSSMLSMFSFYPVREYMTGYKATPKTQARVREMITLAMKELI